MIAVAEKEGKRIIVVVLKSKNRFLDAVNLLDYGLSSQRKSGILSNRIQYQPQLSGIA